jgi:hypothetical protein
MPSGSGLPHRDVRRDANTDEPAKKVSRSVSRVSCETVGLKVETLFGPLSLELHPDADRR